VVEVVEVINNCEVSLSYINILTTSHIAEIITLTLRTMDISAVRSKFLYSFL
jgi:hypothetical protein